MKKLFFLALMGIAALSASAQNIQIHYDFGEAINSSKEKNRQDVTITYEKFSADNLGSWFYFIDADIAKDGVVGAYTELSREFNVGNNGFAAHVEYDGGLSNGGGVFQSAMLIGPAWNGHNADFSTTYSVQVMYKQFFGQSNGVKPYSSFQVTGVWGTTFADGKCTFSGFADFWLGKDSYTGDNNIVFLAEPQLWYNINKSVSVGTEVELSNNFIYRTTDFRNKGFFVNPTLAVKFNL